MSSSVPALIGDFAEHGMLSPADVKRIIAESLGAADVSGKKVLVVIPDATRSAPVGLMFRAIYERVGEATAALDVLIALDAHSPMNNESNLHRLELTAIERAGKYGRMRIFNHRHTDSDMFRKIGVIPQDVICGLSNGHIKSCLDVAVSKLLYNYDLLIILSPVFPHKSAGFTGGNKVLCPGVSDLQMNDTCRILGSVLANRSVIGEKMTSVRKLIDQAASFIAIPKLAFCMVVADYELAGLFVGDPEEAWTKAAELSAKLHILYKPNAFNTVLSCAQPSFTDLWSCAAGIVRVAPVVADGGELILYGPQINSFSMIHSEAIKRIGYHCADYFRNQWDKFQSEPWTVLAHLAGVCAGGCYKDDVEGPRINVTLATQIPEDVCKSINLGYRDPASIHLDDFRNREDDGVLMLPYIGEKSYCVGAVGEGG